MFIGAMCNCFLYYRDTGCVSKSLIITKMPKFPEHIEYNAEYRKWLFCALSQFCDDLELDYIFAVYDLNAIIIPMYSTMVSRERKNYLRDYVRQKVKFSVTFIRRYNTKYRMKVCEQLQVYFTHL